MHTSESTHHPQQAAHELQAFGVADCQLRLRLRLSRDLWPAL